MAPSITINQARSTKNKPTVYILYHFFYPDDVVSAELNKELALGLVAQGWEVTVLTSNRYCREQEKQIDLLNEQWQGMQIVRVPRAQHRQSSHIGRLRHSLAMQRGWLKVLKTLAEPDVLILGTDPQFSPLMFPSLRKRMPRAKLVLWVFDLYPEILEAVGSSMVALAAKAMRPLMKRAYRPVDLLVDIGPCMRQSLAAYAPRASRETMVPWALVEKDEPGEPDEGIRRELFGEAKLGILYSGTIGQAHVFTRFIKLARLLRSADAPVAFCFAGTGNRHAQLQALVGSDDSNIRFAGFCPVEDLEARLDAADLHMISLRPGWEGTVVPSKFFAALAAGKPVLYDGAGESDIGIWVKQFDLGMLLGDDNFEELASHLTDLADDSQRLRQWQQNALEVYRREFAREKMIDKWGAALAAIVND